MECVDYLCSIPGIDMSLENLYHQSALHIAARDGSVAMLSLLLSKHDFDLELIDNIGVHFTLTLLPFIMQRVTVHWQW